MFLKKIVCLLILSCLCHEIQAENHPRLYQNFENFESPPGLEKKLLRSVGKNLKTKFLFSGKYFHFEERKWRESWKHIGNLAMAYRLSSDIKYFNQGREALFALCSYSHWGDPNDKDVNLDMHSALPLMQMAVAYDWLYKNLNSAERQKIRSKLVAQIKPYLDLLEGKRKTVWMNSTNHYRYVINYSAAYVACRAIEPELKMASSWADKFRTALNRVLDSHEKVLDGSLTEGVSLGSLSDHGLLLYLELERQLDGRRDFLKNPWLKNRLSWLEGMTLPRGEEMLSVGDSTEKTFIGPDHILHLYSTWYKDSRGNKLLSLLRKRVSEPQPSSEPWLFLDMLWLNEWPDRAPLNDRGLYHFSDWGLVTSRSDWGREGSFFSFKYGSFYSSETYPAEVEKIFRGNFQPDLGSFTWFYKNRQVVSASGYSTHKKTQNHNTLTIDGLGQQGEDKYGFESHLSEEPFRRGVMENIYANEGKFALSSELKSAYPKSLGLKKFKRNIIYLDTGIFILIDDIECEEVRELELRFHSLDLPLTLRSGGYYQKVSGMRAWSTSFPKSTWETAWSRQGFRKRDNHYAKLQCRSKDWLNVVVFASLGSISGLKVERLEGGLCRVTYHKMGDENRFILQSGEGDQPWLTWQVNGNDRIVLGSRRDK